MEKDLDKFSEYMMYAGVGIVCYGIMSGMILYLILSMKFHPVMYALIILFIFCISMVVYSIFKVIKINQTKPQ